MSIARSRAAYVLGVVLAIGGGLAFLLMAVIVGAIILKGEAKDSVMAALLGVFLLASGLPLAGGVLLLRRSDPGLGSRLRARFSGFRAATLAPGSWRGALLSPIGMALAFYLASVVLVLLHHDTGALVSFGLICVYGLWHPIRNLRTPSWWRSTAVSFFVFFALTVAVAGLTDLKDGGAMVYLAPVMYYPAWVIVMGLVRLLMRATAKTPDAPSSC